MMRIVDAGDVGAVINWNAGGFSPKNYCFTIIFKLCSTPRFICLTYILEITIFKGSMILKIISKAKASLKWNLGIINQVFGSGYNKRER